MAAKEPTRLGHWLLKQMSQHNLSQTDLGALVGVAQATISRWIYRPDIQPEREKIELLPAALRLSVDELAELAEITGFNLAADTIRVAGAGTPLHPLAVEIGRMLEPTSPISVADRRVLEELLDRIVEPHRKTMRGRRRKAG
ncbi:helix-turn-helix domain-containing protein [Dactylosporangium sucinum]|uniref:HTH cro/C1-type domain-containing protein n=1 Tax=Dactylosporangium sucinum TaxID=1424081 RepID=A0A917X8R3_9ACTN|nr:helix-turn-helix transcriptional regulator [Dactylosporangium sucinum]GGM90718.1 hypothetical protein GCM10007977_110910 [Dactylosporangium sucinum]